MSNELETASKVVEEKLYHLTLPGLDDVTVMDITLTQTEAMKLHQELDNYFGNLF